MKILALSTLTFGALFASYGLNLEDVSPALATNTKIIWEVPAGELPQSIWIYRKMPRVFSIATISNAVLLASFESKGFPKPSTSPFFAWADHNESEPQPPYFEITPKNGEISYFLGDRAPEVESEYFTDAAAVDRAWTCLAQLAIDRRDFVKANVAGRGEWGVFLPRQVDGIQFCFESEGFSFQQFGKQKKMRSFSIAWPNLKRLTNSAVASPQQIIACVRARKTPLSPPENEEFNYLERIKTLSKMTKLTIIKVTPFYVEGSFGTTPTVNEMPKTICPIAELEAVADLGTNNLTIRLISPILGTDVSRVLTAM
jgi:hypothetical protein